MIADVGVIANVIIDELIAIKDSHRDVLTSSEIDTLNDACNLISHNIKELKST
jgi:hypothetical protein